VDVGHHVIQSLTVAHSRKSHLTEHKENSHALLKGGWQQGHVRVDFGGERNAGSLEVDVDQLQSFILAFGDSLDWNHSALHLLNLKVVQIEVSCYLLQLSV
jgi:hypothetical protein